TRAGPGHVPGSAGLGQEGNSVVVGRRNGYGAPFAGLSGVRRGASVLVTTTQGQSVYKVRSIRHVDVSDSASTATPTAPTSSPPTCGRWACRSAGSSRSAASSTSAASTTTGATTTTSGATTTTTSGTGARAVAGGSRYVQVDDLYGPSADNRLTIVTSGSR